MSYLEIILDHLNIYMRGMWVGDGRDDGVGFIDVAQIKKRE